MKRLFDINITVLNFVERLLGLPTIFVSFRRPILLLGLLLLRAAARFSVSTHYESLSRL